MDEPLVNGSKMGTKYFASLYVGAFKADKICLKGGQPSTLFLCPVQEPYIILDVVPTGFRLYKWRFSHAESNGIPTSWS